MALPRGLTVAQELHGGVRRPQESGQRGKRPQDEERRRRVGGEQHQSANGQRYRERQETVT